MKTKTLVLLLMLLQSWSFAVAECPLDLLYVRQLRWNKSSCKSAISGGSDDLCCQTLLRLLGVGLGFQLPTNASAVSCLGLFQQQLDSLVLSPDWVSICLKNKMSVFVSSPLLCAGIQTKQDWIRKVGTTKIDSACKGDLSDLAACQACRDSGDLVRKKLVDMNKNLTVAATGLKCYDFTALYAAGIVNEFGPRSRSTAHCVFRVPFVKTSSTCRVLTCGFMAVVAALAICVLGLLYTRGVWFGIQEINAVTNNRLESPAERGRECDGEICFAGYSVRACYGGIQTSNG